MPVMNAAMTLSRELSLFQPGRDRNLLVFEGPRGNLGNSLSTHFLVFNGCVCVCVPVGRGWKNMQATQRKAPASWWI